MQQQQQQPNGRTAQHPLVAVFILKNHPGLSILRSKSHNQHPGYTPPLSFLGPLSRVFRREGDRSARLAFVPSVSVSVRHGSSGAKSPREKASCTCARPPKKGTDGGYVDRARSRRWCWCFGVGAGVVQGGSRLSTRVGLEREASVCSKLFSGRLSAPPLSLMGKNQGGATREGKEKRREARHYCTY